MPMRRVRCSLEDFAVTAKAVGWTWPATMLPAAVAAPLPPVTIRASPESLTVPPSWYFEPSKVEDRAAVPRDRPASDRL